MVGTLIKTNFITNKVKITYSADFSSKSFFSKKSLSVLKMLHFFYSSVYSMLTSKRRQLAYRLLKLCFQKWDSNPYCGNTIRVSNSLDPDQTRLFVGPDLVLNCLLNLY